MLTLHAPRASRMLRSLGLILDSRTLRIWASMIDAPSFTHRTSYVPPSQVHKESNSTIY